MFDSVNGYEYYPQCDDIWDYGLDAYRLCFDSESLKKLSFSDIDTLKGSMKGDLWKELKE